MDFDESVNSTNNVIVADCSSDFFLEPELCHLSPGAKTIKKKKLDSKQISNSPC